MYVIITGAGKVGWNLARELIAKDREVTLIESDHARYRVVEEELEHAVQYGDATELWVLERAGIQRADLVIAVTGDDEDNILICQVAKEKYGVQRIVARVNNPRNLQHFRLLGVQPAVSATDLILRLIEHEVPEYGFDPAARPRGGAPGDHRGRSGGGVAGGRQARPGRGPARRIADHLRAARRRGLRAQGRLGDRGRRPGAADPRPRARIRDHAAVRRWAATGAVSDRHVDYALIGGGLAAGNCARWLRESGADGSILLIGRESDLPYNRPPCSKGYLQGKESREDVLFRPPQWYEEQQIEALTRVSAMKLDPSERVVTLSNRQTVSFDQALRRDRGERQAAQRPRLPSSKGSTTCARSATATRSATTPRASAWC